MSKQKTTTKSSRPNSTRQAGFFSLVGTSSSPGETSAHLNASTELHRVGISGSRDAKPIAFGAPSSSGKQSNSSSSLLQDLVGKSTPSGVSKLLGGGILDFVTGSLFSGLSGLFGGGKAAPPPLERFSLPASVNQTLNVSDSSNQATIASHGAVSTPNVAYSDRNAEIVKAVRDALLTSSSLNDVISEI